MSLNHIWCHVCILEQRCLWWTLTNVSHQCISILSSWSLGDNHMLQQQLALLFPYFLFSLFLNVKNMAIIKNVVWLLCFSPQIITLISLYWDSEVFIQFTGLYFFQLLIPFLFIWDGFTAMLEDDSECFPSEACVQQVNVKWCGGRTVLYVKVCLKSWNGGLVDFELVYVCILYYTFLYKFALSLLNQNLF